jgi:hypothetical protein
MGNVPIITYRVDGLILNGTTMSLKAVDVFDFKKVL